MVELWLTLMRKVLGSNLIGDIAFSGGKNMLYCYIYMVIKL
jgi:hypothetical protein